MPSEPSLLQIIESPPERHRPALEMVFRHLGRAERRRLVAALLKMAASDGVPLSGLFEARRGEKLAGAAWAQVQPGAIATVYPPALRPREPESTSDTLLKTALDSLWAKRVCVAQSLLPRDYTLGAMRLEKAGFEQIADLLYFASFLSDVRNENSVNSPLQFLPYTPSVHGRLARLIERTYEATLDCPRLGTARNIDDVIAGYRATGVLAPQNWLLAQSDGHDVGCVLLADHPAQEQMEVLYLGVVPEVRGRRFGRHLVRHAQQVALQAGRSRLVLSVDAENRFAVDVYAATGFFQWDQRRAYLKVLAAANGLSSLR